jgi:hypothetical protein
MRMVLRFAPCNSLIRLLIQWRRYGRVMWWKGMVARCSRSGRRDLTQDCSMFRLPIVVPFGDEAREGE